MEKTLYVTDLDGTLMRSDQSISKYTADTIHYLVTRGLTFSYATARSHYTASKIMRGVTAQIPIITYNGSFILNSRTNEILASNFFGSGEISEISKLLTFNTIQPIVYSWLNGAEKYSYLSGTPNLRDFLHNHRDDPRERPVSSSEKLYAGKIFYFTCIDTYEKLAPVYETLRESYSCVFQKDIYSGEQWLEIMPKYVSKASAVLQLKELLQCDKIVAFGDGINDLSLFQIADERYAVQNAASELKEIATGIIGGNDDDGVANWLWEHVVII